MAETNKSKMMSEAEIIEAINADTLVSVSLGEGQPQKNVKLSTLASVVAGYLPYVTNKYTNEKDFNNIKSVGSYPFGVALSGFSNIPNVASLEGLLIVIKSTSSNNIIQIYIGIQDNSCHLRTCYNGAWISWKKIV